ncbi:AP2 domain-containing protein [Luteolibacter pohnpeiensis]|uniref:AP2 domain-containing protein n=1 Tax=Luteolibacter pohnpeiensis TaxID=454153 RepID=A0A934S9B1_9BACT|nr:AP2/ERF family transcription factor [Luteolibacter pohnpeiensis]MBK1881193.1 AP2 domain-containing protein [Luteolibacter pohnpeiensis]
MKDTTDTFAITRMDRADSSTFGWQVRLQRHGTRYAKYFADRGHGGSEQSLDAAKKWRDDLLEKFTEDDRARVCSRSSRNSSGVVGVSKVTIHGAQGVTYHFWQATWSPGPGQRKSIRFSVKRHGEKEAFNLAVQARRNGTGIKKS